MPRPHSRDKERIYERYLENRYQQEEEEEHDRWIEEQERLAYDPVHQIKMRMAACVGGTRETRILGFLQLFEYVLTIPDFVWEHNKFRVTVCAKASEVANEPALVDVCGRILAAFSPNSS